MSASPIEGDDTRDDDTHDGETRDGDMETGQGPAGPSHARSRRKPGKAVGPATPGEHPRAALTGERRAAAGRLYRETGVSMDHIARTFGIHPETVRRTAEAEGWRRGTALGIAADGLGAACPGVALCPVRLAAHRRLHATLERRLREVEDEAVGRSAADRERAVRALSSLTRTLDKLTTMDRQAATLAARQGEGRQADQEAAPYDVDGLRRELSRRLEGLLGQGEGG